MTLSTSFVGNSLPAKDAQLSADMTHWSTGNITDVEPLLALHAANGDQIS